MNQTARVTAAGADMYYPRRVRAEDIRSFVGRDWARVTRAKAQHWRERVGREGAGAALRIADALREHAVHYADAALLASERDADFAHHLELKRRIDAASAALRR